MNFYDYYQQDDTAVGLHLAGALALAEMGFKVMPCDKKLPTDKIKSVSKLRVSPLHEKNIPFYFSDPCNVAILTGDTLEVIDVDCKYDLSGKLWRQLASAIEFTLPDLWEKIVIQKSSSGGYHLFYKCSQIGGNTTLAQRKASDKELEKGERVKVLIETRGEGGYIMVCPTKGYEFIQGNPSTIAVITPDERAELMAICRSFNLLDTLQLPGIGNKQRNDPDAPWNAFNAKNNWVYIKDRLIAAGWEVMREDDERVFVLRPGDSMQKSSGTIWKQRNFLYLFSTSTEFPSLKPISAFDVVLYMQYAGDIQAAARGLSELGYGNYKKEDGEFYEKNEKGFIKPKLRLIIDWLNDIGIKKYYISDIDFQIVHVVENKIKIIDLNYIKKLFCDYIHKTCTPEVDEFFLSKFTGMFNREGLINLIEPLGDNFMKSSRLQGWLFFRNTAIDVSAKEIRFVDYASLPGYIWHKNIIQRDISPEQTDCNARTFIKRISGELTNAFECCIGYLLHSFKDPSNPRVVILNDEFFEEDQEREPQGGTGKGMFIQLLSKFKNTVIIDGKGFSFIKSFLYQRINPDTELVAFEDVRKGFEFEKLFSLITDGWTIEKKGLTEFTLPFDRSPKILITSNYPVRGSSASHLRRRYELEVRPHYSHLHNIEAEFGHLFFYDWNKTEWNKFDNYMVECLQNYLSTGLPEQKYVNLKAAKLIEETNIDFITWIESVGIPDQKVNKIDLLRQFTDLNPDYLKGKFQVTVHRFSRWLHKYCEFRNVKLDSNHAYNGVMSYNFNKSEMNNLKILREVNYSKIATSEKSEIPPEIWKSSNPEFEGF